LRRAPTLLVVPTSLCPLFFWWHAVPRHLHLFPTRRSSDLAGAVFVWRVWRLFLPERGFISVCPVPGDDKGIGLARPGETYSLVIDRKSTRLNSSHVSISYAVFCLKKNTTIGRPRRSTQTDR